MSTEQQFRDCVNEAFDLALLPYCDYALRRSVSSYDRTGGNRDYNNYLYTDENGERVIFDEYGPGCVFRLFLPTVHSPNEHIRFYLDGADVPTYEGSFADTFGGSAAGFPNELVDTGVPPHSAFTSYVPMPFQKRLKITADCDKTLFYHNIDFKIYPPETNVRSWSVTQDNAPLCRAMTEGVAASGQTSRFDFDLAPGKKSEAAVINACEASVVSEFRIAADGFGLLSDNGIFSALDRIKLMAVFDCAAEPQINVSLAELFGFSRFGVDLNSRMSADDVYNHTKTEGAYYRTVSYAAGIDKDGFYLRLPMPFYRASEFTLENESGVNFSGSIHVKTSGNQRSEPFGYLFVKRTQFTAGADDSRDINYCRLEGTGALVGVNASMDSDKDVENSTYLEGDEHVFIDGCRTPQINGTGTEDFYNGAYYWYNGTHSKPLYGCSFNAKWMRAQKHCPPKPEATYKSSAYRYMVGDAVVFHSALDFNMEHGFENDRFETGSAALFYYYRPQNTLAVTDMLSITEPGELTGNAEGHNYAAVCAQVTECRSRFEGARSLIPLTMPGNLLCAADGASSSFTLAVKPEAEHVVLRRTFEYTFANQQADIYVDGEPAGRWYNAGCNVHTRLREDDFILPRALTSGKQTLNIKVVPCAGYWSEIMYKALCVGVISKSSRSAAVKRVKRRPDAFVEIAAFIAESVEENSPVSISALAAEYYISQAQIRRVIRRNSGMSFTNYMLSLRVEKSRRLLVNSELTVKAVAAACGFSDAGYFSRVFKKITGVSCSEYRAGAKEHEAGKTASDPDI